MCVHETQDCDVHSITVNIHYKNYLGLEFQGRYCRHAVNARHDVFDLLYAQNS